MRHILFPLILMVISAVAAQAESRYVTDNIPITLRSGAGTSHKVLESLEAATLVEIITPGPDWSEVRTPSGKTGWAMTRFLTRTPPSKIAYEQLKKKHEDLIEKSTDPIKEMTRLKEKNQKLKDTLDGARQKADKLSRELNTLKSESSDFLKIKKNYEDVSAQLAEKTEMAERQERQLSKTFFNKNIRWFLSGAGVLLVGFIIGYGSKKGRKRGSSLY